MLTDRTRTLAADSAELERVRRVRQVEMFKHMKVKGGK